MEIEPQARGRTVRFVILAIGLLAMAVMLTVLLHLTLAAAHQMEGVRQKYLARLAIVVLVMLGMTLVMLVWLATRFIIDRLRPSHHAPTPYVDAWAAAGKRFKLAEDDDVGDLEGDTDEGRDEEDGEGDGEEDGGGKPPRP